MTDLRAWTLPSAWTDPGPHAALLDALPTDLRELTAVVRNLVVHYRAGGVELDAERLAEVDLRRLDRRLDADQRRFGAPLAAPRPRAGRVAGCCRDFTLLTVAALRHRGVPARSRVGFVGYFDPGFHSDHVVAEYWDGGRWVLVDAELDPATDRPFDPVDVPQSVGGFRSAARVWTDHRRGLIDGARIERYGLAPETPFRGAWYVHNYVLLELAHRRRDELLLWDSWGAMAQGPDGVPAPELVDEVAGLLLAADSGDAAAERELADRYAADPRLHPGPRVLSFSPTGIFGWTDLDPAPDRTR